MRTLAVTLAMVVAPLVAAAQTTAVVEQTAPIYASNIPAANLAPLYIAPAGTVLRVIGEAAGWWHVEFDDPKWGARTGWVEKAHVRRSDSTAGVSDPATGSGAPRRPGVQRREVSPATSRLFADLSFTTFAAEETFDTALGSSSGMILGGGFEVIIRERFGISARAGRYSRSGERTFLYDGERYGLGIPLRVKVTPIMIGADYRITRTRVSPYVGGDAGVYRYDETSSFAEGDENVSSTFGAYGVHGGVHVQVARWVGVATEIRWITVPGALGEGGVSREFDEEDLGGLGAAVRLTIGR